LELAGRLNAEGTQTNLRWKMKVIRSTRSRASTGGIMLLTAVAAAGMLVLANVPAMASAPMSIASWPAQIAHPAAESCPPGATLVAPTSGWRDALGVAHFRYQAAAGLVSNVPPPRLTASQVTPAMVRDSGLAAGQDTGALAERHLVQQVQDLAKTQQAPEFCRSWAPAQAGLSLPEASGVPGLRNTHVGSGNWGGYAVTEAENGGTGINGASGAWKPPG
jgi:hypothetical protein